MFSWIRIKELGSAMGTLQICQNWKRNSQASFKLCKKVFVWVIVFGLLIGVLFFVYDVLNHYQSKKSGVKSSIEIQEKIVPPTIHIWIDSMVLKIFVALTLIQLVSSKLSVL